MRGCKTVLFPNIEVRGTKVKGTFNLGGKQTLSLQLMQVGWQEGGGRQAEQFANGFLNAF